MYLIMFFFKSWNFICVFSIQGYHYKKNNMSFLSVLRDVNLETDSAAVMKFAAVGKLNA